MTLLVYLGLGVILYFLQGALIFGADPTMTTDPGARGWTFEDVRLPVEGHETHGWYIPLENHRAVVLFSRGNAGNLSYRLENIAVLRSLGLSVLAYDYGGFGDSTGTPSEARCYADINAMWDYLVTTRGVAPEDIILYGRSLGGGPTTELATRVTPGAVVLESTFLSTADVAWEMPVYRPWIWLLRHRFDSARKIGNIHAPLLILHSPQDEVIPITAVTSAPPRCIARPGKIFYTPVSVPIHSPDLRWADNGQKRHQSHLFNGQKLGIRHYSQGVSHRQVMARPAMILVPSRRRETNILQARPP